MSSKESGFFVRPRHTSATSKQHQKPNQKQDGISKKPFDKRKWREQKYSHKHKLDAWQEKRKKAIVAQYKKQMKDEQRPKFDAQKIYEEYADEEDEDKKSETEVKKKKLWEKPHEKYERLQKEKQERNEEARRKRDEREAERKEAMRKRNEKNRVFKKKTQKGQPVMKDRLELLLKQIEQSVQSE